MIKDPLYTHKFANEKVALNAKEIGQHMIKNSLSFPTVCLCDLDLKNNSNNKNNTHNQITKS